MIKIESRNGTIRVEDKSGSSSWPLYMAIPSSVTSRLFKDVFNALKIAAAGDPSIEFELREGGVYVDGEEISPESIPAAAKAACDVVYGHDGGVFAEIYPLRQLKDSPVKRKKTIPTESIEIVDGKAVLTIVEIEQDVQIVDVFNMVDSNGTVVNDKDGNPRRHGVKRMNLVSQADKDRLAELEAKIASL